jgi:ribose 5-phosphate isomerase B
MKIVIGADHRGFLYKQQIVKELSEIEWVDIGCINQERCDFPDVVKSAIEYMKLGKVERAVLLCGSGVGMAIAANRFSGIYAAVAWNKDVARVAREHNNANILVLPADFVTIEDVLVMIAVWHNTEFLGGHYQKRIDAITALPKSLPKLVCQKR